MKINRVVTAHIDELDRFDQTMYEMSMLASKHVLQPVLTFENMVCITALMTDLDENDMDVDINGAKALFVVDQDQQGLVLGMLIKRLGDDQILFTTLGQPKIWVDKVTSLAMKLSDE